MSKNGEKNFLELMVILKYKKLQSAVFQRFCLKND